MRKERIRKWFVSYRKDGEGGGFVDTLSGLKDVSKYGDIEFERDGYLTIEGLEPSATYGIAIGREIEIEGNGVYVDREAEVYTVSTEKGEIRISFSGLYHKIG